MTLSQLRHHEFEIVPDFPLVRRSPEQIRRVVGRHQRNSLVMRPASAKSSEGLVGAGEPIGREAPEGDNDIGLDELDLAIEKSRACRDLVVLGISIPGRSAFDHIGDVGPASVKTHGDDHPVEQLSGLTDKGSSGSVLLGSRSFADEHQPGVRCTFAENHSLAFLAEATPRTPLERPTEALEISGMGKTFRIRGR